MNFKKTKNADIQLSKKNRLSKDEFEPRNVKERITIFLDQDILDYFRSLAKKDKKKYQTLINDSLRDCMTQPSLEERINRLEKKMKKIAS